MVGLIRVFYRDIYVCVCMCVCVCVCVYVYVCVIRFSNNSNGFDVPKKSPPKVMNE